MNHSPYKWQVRLDKKQCNPRTCTSSVQRYPALDGQRSDGIVPDAIDSIGVAKLAPPVETRATEM